MTDDLISLNDELHRFEIAVEDDVAFLDYELDGDVLTLIHTEVPEALEGRGLGSKLAKFALAYAKDKGLAVVPRCAFVRSFLERKPEAADGIRIVEYEP